MRQEILYGWQVHLAKKYGLRTATMVGGISQRLDMLSVAVTAFTRARDRDQLGKLDRRLADIFAWACSVANYFGFDHKGGLYLDLTDSLMIKYPSAGCGYCQQSPCVCPPERRAQKLFRADDDQRGLWNLDEWVGYFWRLYGEKNANQPDPISFCAGRLYGEIAELAELCRFGRRVAQATPALIMRQFGQELADVLAWTFGIVAQCQRGRGLERWPRFDFLGALIQRHGTICLVCDQEVCACGPFANKGSIQKLEEDLAKLSQLSGN